MCFRARQTTAHDDFCDRMILNDPQKTPRVAAAGTGSGATSMKIALGADHRGDAALKALAPQLRAAGHEIQILGDCSGQPCDYPDQAYMVAKAIADGEAERGILICGSGI